MGGHIAKKYFAEDLVSFKWVNFFTRIKALLIMPVSLLDYKLLYYMTYILYVI